MLLEDFSTNTPSFRTDSGRRDSTIFSLFCTSTAAMSGSVPCVNVAAISTAPSELLVADMYIRPGAPLISFSITAVTASSVSWAERPDT